MERKPHSVPLLTDGCFFAALVLCLAFSFLFVPAVFAGEENQDLQKRELYQWKDDQGNVHISDDAGQIPEKYRSRADKIESVKGTEPASPPSRQRMQDGAARRTPNEQAEDLQRKSWQGRLKEWRDKRANAENRLLELKRKHEEALGNFGGPTTGRGVFLIEAQRLEQEMEKVQQEIDEARDQIENVIPEDARKAGVPPGWLRE